MMTHVRFVASVDGLSTFYRWTDTRPTDARPNKISYIFLETPLAFCYKEVIIFALLFRIKLTIEISRDDTIVNFT